jgi:nucleoside-diphosphate-sugar epimerase
MSAVLVTGATGFVGRQLAIRLAREGKRVHALYRSPEKIGDWKDPNIRFFHGNLRDSGSIRSAMRGCAQVYHVAAYVSSWAKDSRIYFQENVGGTVNVLDSALDLGVEKLVFTSTAGVLGPSDRGVITENRSFPGRHYTHYDRSKAEAERKVMDYFSRGLQAVIVNPTRIYGPGSLSTANALTRLIGRYLQGKWRIIPGDGHSIGNYVFIEDVVNCHILAMEKGRPGERYLAGGQNLSFNEFFKTLERVSGTGRRLYRLPDAVMMTIAGIFYGWGKMTGWNPPITPSFVRRYRHNWEVSIRKAEMELGYVPITFEEGLRRTLAWIEHQHTH